MRNRTVMISMLVFILIGMIPWVDGWLVKSNYLAFIANLNATNQQSKIKVIDYSLGWLGSAVTLHLEPIEGKQNMQDKNITSAFTTTIEQSISHGPYVYDDVKKQWKFALAEIQSDVTFPSLWNALLIKQQGEKSDLHIDTLMSFSQNLTNHITMPIFSLKPIMGTTKVIWNRLIGDINVEIEDHQIKKIVGNKLLNSIVIKNDTTHINLNEIRIEYDLNYQPTGVWSGNYQITIPAILMNDFNGLNVALRNLRMNSKFGVDRYNLYNAELTISLNTGSMADFSIMPSFVKLSAENINSKGLATVLHLFPQKIEKMSAVLPATINLTTHMNEVVNINTSLGGVSSAGTVFWPKEKSLPQSIDDIQAHYNMKIDVHVSRALVNKIIELIYGTSSPDNQKTPLNQLILSQPAEQTLLNQVDAWKDQNTIALNVAYQLKDLIKRKLPARVFGGNIDQYVLRKDLPENLATQLKAAYLILHPDPKDSKVPALPMTLPSPVVQLTPADRAHAQINQWIKQGIIKQDQENYMLSIVRH